MKKFENKSDISIGILNSEQIDSVDLVENKFIYLSQNIKSKTNFEIDSETNPQVE